MSKNGNNRPMTSPENRQRLSEQGSEDSNGFTPVSGFLNCHIHSSTQPATYNAVQQVGKCFSFSDAC